LSLINIQLYINGIYNISLLTNNTIRLLMRYYGD